MLASQLLSAARPGRARTLRDVDERVVLDACSQSNPELLTSDLRSIAESRALRDTLLDSLHLLAQNGVTTGARGAGREGARCGAPPTCSGLYGAYRAATSIARIHQRSTTRRGPPPARPPTTPLSR
jgi:hypothetical protein